MGVKGGGGGAACQCRVFNGAEMEREKKWGRKEKRAGSKRMRDGETKGKVGTSVAPESKQLC